MKPLPEEALFELVLECVALSMPRLKWARTKQCAPRASLLDLNAEQALWIGCIHRICPPSLKSLHGGSVPTVPQFFRIRRGLAR